MSDNVVLSKHFDSLASAIQRCLSAGYAPTAYIPAGHESVIDNVASTVDGGIWYEHSAAGPIIKFHDKNVNFRINVVPKLDAALVVYLHFHQSGNPAFEDNCKGNWECNDNLSSSIIPLIPLDLGQASTGYYSFGFLLGNGSNTLTRSGDLVLGSSFTINFWGWISGTLPTVTTPFARFYTTSGDEALNLFCWRESSDSATKIGVTYNNESYEFTLPESDNSGASNFEFGFQPSGITFFFNGELQSTVSANIRETTYTSLILGMKDVSKSYNILVGELKIYQGVALHSSDFAPTFEPQVIRAV